MQDDREHIKPSKSASRLAGSFGVGNLGRSTTVWSKSCVIDCRKATGLETNEKDDTEANSKGGALGPTDIEVRGALSTRWSSISWRSRSNSRHTAVVVVEWKKNRFFNRCLGGQDARKKVLHSYGYVKDLGNQGIQQPAFEYLEVHDKVFSQKEN